MLIDWWTVGAQALNFIVLIWLMKHFLYKPILSAIDAREQRIAKQIADADATKAEAGKEREEFQQKNETFDKERADRLTKVSEDAKSEGDRLLAEARKAADELSVKRREALANDTRNLNDAILRKTQEEVFAIARKALGDLASTELEQSLASVFIRKLGTMDAEAKKVFGEALKSSDSPALLRSAFDLPEDTRNAIQKALNETFSTQVRLSFVTEPDRIGGIELSARGQKVAWSIANYLSSLETAVGELANPKSKAGQGSAPESSTLNKVSADDPATIGA